jgi:hypothetical protein
MYVLSSTKKVGKMFLSNSIPKPYEFITTGLQADLDLSEIITQVGTLLPQLANFIGQFNTLITQSGVNVITDTAGNMSIEVASSMSSTEAEFITKKIGVIDRLINSHGTTLNDLFQKGLSIENKYKVDDPNYVSQLSEKIEEFKKLNSSYKH